MKLEWSSNELKVNRARKRQISKWKVPIWLSHFISLYSNLYYYSAWVFNFHNKQLQKQKQSWAECCLLREARIAITFILLNVGFFTWVCVCEQQSRNKNKMEKFCQQFLIARYFQTLGRIRIMNNFQVTTKLYLKKKTFFLEQTFWSLLWI